jgi:endonuclease/exonuclease/phosphatase family metal-dependent hydrolase
MKLRKPDLFLLLFLLCAFFIYSSPFFSPYWKYFSILNIFVPFFLVFHFVILVISFRKKKWKRFLLLAFIGIFAFSFLKSTLSFSIKFSSIKEKTISVLSYNVHGFNKPANNDFRKTDVRKTKEMVSTIAGFDADIICLQEFFDFEASEVYNSIEQITKSGFDYFAFDPVIISRSGKKECKFGNIIFSRFPILSQKTIKFDSLNNNQIICCDIVVRKDTVRVFNAHIASLNKANSNITIVEKYIINSDKRMKQTQILLKELNESPYRIILCGDFNDIPYSYTYYCLSGCMKNCFEKSGTGFGFSYPSEFPLLRIDNIFAGQGIEVIDFSTHNTIKYSDHLPISAKFILEN